MKKRVLLLPLLLLFVILVTVTGTAVADNHEPDYWLDETTLPFDPVPSFEDSTRL